MRKKAKGNKLLRFFRWLYLKLFRINDTPQRIALGLGLGVFLGILPGSGPVAALFLAFLLRVNRASALLGSLITNTWLSIVTFVLAVKLGAYLLGLEWQQVYTDCIVFFKLFRFSDLLRITALKVLLPVILGYILVSLLLGFVVYLIALAALKKVKK